MQSQPQEQTPLPPPVKVPTITIIGTDGKTEVLPIPSTGTALNELYSRRQELNAQLSSTSSRRRAVAEEMGRTSDAAARTGLEQRLRLLDQRLIQLETDIAATSRQITAAAPGVLEESRFQRQKTGDDFTDGFAAGGATLFLAMTVVLLVMRRRWKRAGKDLVPETRGDSPRLQRVEQAVDAIAVEVERISEGQRFVTKLLSESPAVGATDRIAQKTIADPSAGR